MTQLSSVLLFIAALASIVGLLTFYQTVIHGESMKEKRNALLVILFIAVFCAGVGSILRKMYPKAQIEANE